MTANVENWKYNSADQLQVLSDEQLLQEEKELSEAIRLFHQHVVPLSDEMFWLMCAIGNEKVRRKNK